MSMDFGHLGKNKGLIVLKKKGSQKSNWTICDLDQKGKSLGF